MKLLRIILRDFRQFYGEQIIEFATGKQNVTLILGENGNGKTGIFRAISFCLFNEKTLEKDDIKAKSQSQVHLVNINRLKENVGRPVAASVVLEFEHEENNYRLERVIYDMLSLKGKIDSGIDEEVNLQIVSTFGGPTKKITRTREVSQIIESIISIKIKDLFFFDGDKIESLSTVNDQSKLEIKNGVLKLLNIDAIRDIHEVLDGLIKDQRNIIKKSSNTKLHKAEQELVQAEGLLKIHRMSQEGFSVLLEKKTKNIEKIQEIQAKSQALKELYKEKNLLINNQNSNDAVIELQRQNIRQYLNQSAHEMLSFKSLERIYAYIQRLEENNQFNSNLTLQLIDEIIHSSTCLCGQHYDETSEFIQKMKNLRHEQELIHVFDFLRDFKMKISAIIENRQNSLNQFMTSLQNFEIALKNQEKLQGEASSLEGEISSASKGNENLTQLIGQLQELQKQVKETSQAMSENGAKIKLLEEEIAKLKQEIKQYSKEDEKLSMNIEFMDYYENLNNVFERVNDTYAERMRKIISNEATEIFSYLISKKDQETVRKIEINANYEINAVGWSDISIFSDISSGQKQMLSLAFVSALAKVASKTPQDIIKMPLFMDTPFAKLDIKNRESLIVFMPQFASQWVLLVTNTELTPLEASILDEDQRVGSMYFIEKIKEGNSLLRNISDINDLIKLGKGQYIDD